jgi:hypothetical protein
MTVLEMTTMLEYLADQGAGGAEVVIHLHRVEQWYSARRAARWLNRWIPWHPFPEQQSRFFPAAVVG